MTGYAHQKKLLAAVDCIIFGFDGQQLKLLLVKRGFMPEEGKWSLMGGFVQKDEDLDAAASRILKKLTGLEDVYMEQLQAFGKLGRDPIERTISVVYYALIDINKYTDQISTEYEAEWFPINKIPKLVFDHSEMVEAAKQRLQYKAALHPILFELLPEKFTLPKLQSLYEGIYEITLDKRNFARKALATDLLVKQKDKEKSTSRRGAYYYKLDRRKYKTSFNTFIQMLSIPRKSA